MKVDTSDIVPLLKDGEIEDSDGMRSSTIAIFREDGKKLQGNKDRRGDIQCLRGVAIIYVLLFHFFPNLFPKGFLGVDIFFVISGYLITMILSRHVPISLSDTATFFSKRIRRIFPAYYAMIFLVLIFGKIFLISFDHELLVIDSAWTLAFSSNIHKYLQQKDYFAQIANYDFLLHAWSLAVEIQFYCMAPLLVSIVHRLRVGKILTVIIAIASIMVHLSTHGQLQFSSLPSRLWQFIAGAIAFQLYREENVLPSPLRKVITFFAVAAISPIILFPTSYDLIWRFVVTLASAVIVGRISPLTNDFFLRGSALLLIGDISYSLYLAHWPVIVFFKYVQNSDSLASKDCWLAAQLSFLVAYLSFKTIEKYFIRADLIKGLLFIATLLCLSVALMFYPNYSAIFVKKSKDESNATTSSSTVGENVTTEKTFFERDCLHFRYQDYRPNKTITKSMLEKAAVANERFTKYWPKEIPEDSLPDPMVDKYFTKHNISIIFTAYYKGPGKTSIMLFGNSFAHRALVAIVNAFGQRIKEIRLLSHAGCPPFIGSTFVDNDDCPSFAKASIELIEEMKPDIIFFIFRPFPPIDSPVHDLSKDIQFQNIQSTIDRISAVSKRIVLEYPLPVNKDKGYTPVLIKRLQDEQPVFDDVMMEYSFFWNNSKHLFKRLDSVKCEICDRIYPHKIFCNLKVCHVFDPDNLFSFFDMGSHYNDYAMKCFKEVYAEIIDQNYANGFIE